MLRLTLASLRRRKTSVLGAFLALFCAAAMVSACGGLLETGIHGSIPPQRYAGTPTVVTADQQIHWTKIKHKHGKIKKKTKSKPLAELAWLPSAVGSRLRAVPGAHVVPERRVVAEIVSPTGGFVPGTNGRTIGLNWQSARLTPYRLSAGSAPTTDRQVVVDRGLAARAHLHVGSGVTVQSTVDPTAYVVCPASPHRSIPSRSSPQSSSPSTRRPTSPATARRSVRTECSGRRRAPYEKRCRAVPLASRPATHVVPRSSRTPPRPA